MSLSVVVTGRSRVLEAMGCDGPVAAGAIRISLGPTETPDFRDKELRRIIKGLRLHILTERQRHRPAHRRIGHHPQGARQGGQNLLRPRDAVEIAAYGFEGIIGRNRAIGFDLRVIAYPP